MYFFIDEFFEKDGCLNLVGWTSGVTADYPTEFHVYLGKKEVPAEEPAFTGPVNIGNPNELTIRELAEKILRLTGSASRVTYCDLPSDDPTRRRPDITLAQEALGWGPSVSLDDGLTETIRYFAKKTR